LCNFLHSPATSPLLGPDILLRTLFSNNLSTTSYSIKNFPWIVSRSASLRSLPGCNPRATSRYISPYCPSPPCRLHLQKFAFFVLFFGFTAYPCIPKGK
jgi:hypothetical protein